MLLDKGAEVVDDCGEVQFRRRRCHSLQNHKMSIQILLSLRERLKEVKLWKVKSPTATPSVYGNIASGTLFCPRQGMVSTVLKAPVVSGRSRPSQMCCRHPIAPRRAGIEPHNKR